MQSTTTLYNRIISANNHWFECKLVIDDVGTFGEDTLFSINTNIEMFQGSPTIGKAVAGEIDVTMLLPSVEIPTMAVLRPYVRVCGYVTASSGAYILNDRIYFEDGDAEIQNNKIAISNQYVFIDDDGYIVFPESPLEYKESEWLPQGVYYIDTRERTKNDNGLDVLTIHGYDAMLKSEQYFESSTITGDSTDIQMVNEIASIMGLTVDARTTALMTAAYTIPLPTGYTLREVLGFIASMYVGCFIITETGKLRLVSILELPPETNYLIDNAGDAITFGGDRIKV